MSSDTCKCCGGHIGQDGICRGCGTYYPSMDTTRCPDEIVNPGPDVPNHDDPDSDSDDD